MAEQDLAVDRRKGENIRTLASARKDKGRAAGRSHELKAMLDGVKRLARFAVETGQFPDEVDIADLHTILTSWEDSGGIKPEEVKRIANYYQALEHQLGPITARTLKATDTHGDTHYRNSAAGRHAISLWAITGLVVLSIFLLEWHERSLATAAKTGAGFLADLHERSQAAAAKRGTGFLHVLANFILPFVYGSLGSCVYLLRVTEKHLRHRDFDCARIPEHWNRLVLGTLSGGALILVLQEVIASTAIGNGVPVTAALLGFLAGYSVDFLFDVIDRILERVLPKGPATAKDEKKLQRKQEAVLSKQTEVLDEMAKVVAQAKGHS